MEKRKQSADAESATPLLHTGTIFQIGALPIVVLGPLGAVSLLYNAFFAKIILGDSFSINLVLGSLLSSLSSSSA